MNYKKLKQSQKSVEIELPPRLLRSLAYLILVICPLMAGMRASPFREDGQPMLLTPRLMRLNEYRREVRGWTRTLKEADGQLTTLLSEKSGDLFDQDRRANQAYQKTSQVAEEIDQTPIPPTFEQIDELVGTTARAYLDTAVAVARWVNDPSDESHQAAVDALTGAQAVLGTLRTNPWIEIDP